MPTVLVAVYDVVMVYLADAGVSVVAAEVIDAVVVVAVAAGLTYGAQKLLSLMQRKATLTDNQQLVKNPLQPRDLVYGRVQKSGTLLYVQQSGNKNQDLYMVVTMASNEVTAMDQFNLNNFAISLDGGFNFTGDTNLNNGAVNAAGFAGKGSLYINDTTNNAHYGRIDQTVDPLIQAAAGAGKWPNTSVLSGIAYLGIHLVYDQNVFGGGIPNPSFIIKGKKLVDPRAAEFPTGTIANATNTLTVSSTAGLANGQTVMGPGVPEQTVITGIAGLVLTLSRNATEDVLVARMYMIGTRAYSNNSAMVVMDYLMDRRYGFKSNPEDFDLNSLIASLNNCDEQIELSDGSFESRYTCNTVIDTSSTPGSILQDLLTTMAGNVVWASGQWFIYSGMWRAPTITLDENDFRDTPIVPTMPSRRDLVNSCKGMFPCPQQFWQPTDFPPYQEPVYIAADQNEVLWLDLQLPGTTSAATAQRLGKIAVLKARVGTTTLSLNCKLTALGIQCADNIYLNYARMGWVNQAFEVTGFTFATFNDQEGKPSLGCNLTLRGTAPTCWDWTAGSETPLPQGPASILPNPFLLAKPTSLLVISNASTLQITPDGIVVPSLLVTWVAPLEDQIQQGGNIQIQLSPAGLMAWQDQTPVLGSTEAAYLTDVVSGNAYDVRIRGITGHGIISDWVVYGNVTAAGSVAAPTTPTSVVATTGPTLVSLAWTLSTDSTIKYYKIYRSLSPSGTSPVFLEQAWSTQFKDTSGTVGTTYYYAVSAVNKSNVESAVSAWSNGAAPGPAGPNTTAPSAPSAASAADAGGTYLATDGSVYGYLDISVPAMPSGAAWQQLEIQKSSTSGFVMFAYLTNTGAQTVTIPDLSPGLVVAVQTIAYNSDGVPSAATAATGSPFTTPSKSAAPSAPSSGGLSMNGIKPVLFNNVGPFLVGTACYWSIVNDLDLAYYEIKGTTTDSDAATDYSGFFNTSGNGAIQATSTLSGCWYQGGPSLVTSIFIRVRSSDTSGNKSAWLRLGELFANGGEGIGTIATQSQTGANVTGLVVGNIGSGGATIQAINHQTDVLNLTGGATDETHYVTIAGFTSKPLDGQAEVTSDLAVKAVYNFDDSGNTSTQAAIRVSRFDGAALSAGNRRFSINLYQ